MSKDKFKQLISTVTSSIEGRALNASLEEWLNAELGVGSETYQIMERTCHDAIEAGWMCENEHAGISYGRVFKPCEETNQFSVDVVDMEDVVGPHHRHPEGEIDLIMPQRGDALFDNRGAGWLVCPPGSAHHPTVTGGRALILYLLPRGSIEFTRQ